MNSIAKQSPKNKIYTTPLVGFLLVLSQLSYAKPKHFDLSLQALGNVVVESPSTLTSISKKDIPSSITTITHQQIKETGARSLDELLEWHVPGYQRHAQSSNSYAISNRGIVGAGRFLLVVNGKTMNEHSQHQAVMERDLTSLGDIAEIQIIRGSSAAIYGHGAFNMVISITTHSSRTFEGTRIQLSTGITEEFINGELATSYKWAADQGAYFYFGLTDYGGADINDSPVFFGVDGVNLNGQPVSANNTTGFSIGNDYQNAGDKLAIKLHAQVDVGDFSLWTRYTRGGKRFTNDIDKYERLPASVSEQHEVAYEQATANLSYKKYFNKQWMADFSIGYDTTEGLRRRGSFALQDTFDETYREDQVLAKLLMRNEYFEDHSFAIGAEYSFERFGLKPINVSDEPVRYASFRLNPSDIAEGKRIEPWSAVTLTGSFEHQWRLNSQFTALSNVRIDARDHIEIMFSPRFSLTYHFMDKDYFNFIISRSNKIPDAPVIRRQILEGGDDFRPTINDSAEIRWNSEWGKNIFSTASVYVQKREFTGWDATKQLHKDVGVAKQWGLEIDVTYQDDKFEVSFSHQFNKLIDLKLNDPNSISIVSAQPNGFGDDLISVHNHISKLNLRYQFTENISGLLNYTRYWGTPGTADFHDFFNHLLANRNGNGPGVRARNNIDRYEFSKSTDYLHLSLNWNILKNTQLGFHGNYLLGFIDDKLNKRGFSHFGYYRSHAPAFSIKVTHDF